ncbi:hypothetical protein PMIN03_002845 [Paraphaeosphaeria minitans]
METLGLQPHKYQLQWTSTELASPTSTLRNIPSPVSLTDSALPTRRLPAGAATRCRLPTSARAGSKINHIVTHHARENRLFVRNQGCKSKISIFSRHGSYTR